MNKIISFNRLRLIVVALILAICSSPLNSLLVPIVSASEPPAEKILFHGINNNYTISPDGSNLTNVDLVSNLSPDGTKAAYSNGADIIIEDIASGATTNLTGALNIPNVTYSNTPIWSPNGSKIMFTSQGGDSNQDSWIYSINTDGTNLHLITSYVQSSPDDSANFVQGWSWSPDGNEILITTRSVDTQLSEMEIVDTNGNILTVFSDGTSNYDTPSWSPDGTKIAFLRGINSYQAEAIDVINIDGSNREDIYGPIDTTNPDQFNSLGAPIWSPDSNKIVYSLIDGVDRDYDQLTIKSLDDGTSIVIRTGLAGDSLQWWRAPIQSNPVITSSSSTSISVRDSLNFTVTTTGSPTASLSESGALPTGINFSDNGDGTAQLSGQPALGTQGSYPITISATNISSTTTQTFTLTVNNNSYAPTFASDSLVTETYGVPFNFTVSATGNPLPTIKKSSGTLPTGVTLVDNGDGTATLSGNLANSSNSGVYTFAIKAKNSLGSSTQNFTLTINKTPIIKQVATKTLTVGTSFTQSISATGYQTPSVTVSGLPDGLSFNDNGDGTGMITGSPNPGSGGIYTATITATNQQGSSTSTFTIKVKEAPTITSSNYLSVGVGNPFSFQITASGFPIPSISKIGTLPKGVTYNTATRTLSGTPASTSLGTYPLVFTAKNALGSVTQNFTLVISNVVAS